MHKLLKKIQLWKAALRAYSLPISIMSWFVPFLYAVFQNGNIINGIIALLGIIALHLATNIFDDAVDYIREKKEIEKGTKKHFNFQKGKCECIFKGYLSVEQYFNAAFFLYFISFLIGLYFIYIQGTKILYIIIPSIILCLSYPLLGCIGLGEIIVAVIFSPLLYLGVYFVMKGCFSLDVLIISVSTGLLSVAVLHNHMLLDFKYDTENRKTTLCRLCGTEQKALYLLGIIIAGAYANIIIWAAAGHLNICYLITLLSLPAAVILYKIMKIHIKTPDKKIKRSIFMGPLKELEKIDEKQQNFMLKFLIVRNLLTLFTVLLCIAIILTEAF